MHLNVWIENFGIPHLVIITHNIRRCRFRLTRSVFSSWITHKLT